MLNDIKNFSPSVPLMRPKHFAEKTGMSLSSVKAHMDKGDLPVTRLGSSTRYINLVKLFNSCSEVGA